MDFVVYQDGQEIQHSARIDDVDVRLSARHHLVRGESEVDDSEDLEGNVTTIQHSKPLGILQDIVITPYLQRTLTEESNIKSDTPIYSLYLAMYEPQKRLHIYKKTTQRLMSISDGYGRISLDFSQDEESSEDNFKARMWYIEILRCFELWASWDPISTILERKTILDALLHLIKTIPRSILEKVSDGSANASSWITAPKSDNEDLNEILECVQLVLTAQDEVNRILRLRGEEAQSFLDLLDNVVTSTDPHSRINDLSQRTLRRLCGRAGFLPSSFILNEGLTKESHHPVATGGFADVFYGHYSGRPVALKALRIYGADSLKRVNKKFCREAVFWRRLEHPNIVPFLGVSSPDSFSLCMVSVWMEYGNLLDYIKKYPKSSRLNLIVDVANGLLYIHTLGLVHGDLKSANVLINNMHQACLSDFGLSSITHDARTASLITTSNALHGSIRWMAPELLHPEHAGRDNGKPSAESDIYAFAMVMLEVFTGKIPFHYHMRDATVVLNVTLGVRPERPGSTVAELGLTDAVWAIMEKCWQTDWQKRPLTPETLTELEESRRLFVPAEIGFDEDNIAIQIDKSDSDSSSDGEDGPSFWKNFMKMKMTLNDNSDDIGYQPPVFSTIPDTQQAHMILEKNAVPDMNVEGHDTPSNETPPNSSWGIFDI